MGDIWQTLGLEPTDDQRAIRSAYIRRLKEIDPDLEPEQFIALREAYEAARGEAEQPASADATAPSASLRPAGSGPTIIETSTPQRASDRIETLLSELSEHVLIPDVPVDEPAIRRLLQELLSPATLTRVDDAMRIEDAILDLIDLGALRAEPLLGPAIRAFGWRELQFPSPTVEWALAMHVENKILIREPDLKPAYDALRSPFSRPNPWKERRLLPLVEALFDLSEKHFPNLADELDPEAWAWWQTRRGRPRLRLIDLMQSLAIGSAVSIAAYPLGSARQATEALLLLLTVTAVTLGGVLVRLRFEKCAGERRGFTLLDILALTVGLCLPIAAAVTPPSIEAMLILAGIAVVTFAMIGNEHRSAASVALDDDDDSEGRAVTGPAFALGVGGLLLYLSDIKVGAMALAPLVTASFITYKSFLRIGPLPAERRILRIALTVMVVILGVLATAAVVYGGLGYPPCLIALPLLILVQHLAIGHEEVPMLTSWHAWCVVPAALLVAIWFPWESETTTGPLILGLPATSLITYRAARLLWTRR
ncbi:J domain-containing protein [Sphingomonas sp. HF-S3]|uniref:J domain-containing protein n=1 Tax=Sphingomonas rustica TaxID=3103142 RepID=A0ABV0B6C1_9SPHN